MSRYFFVVGLVVSLVLVGCSYRPSENCFLLDPSVKTSAVELHVDTIISAASEDFVHAKMYYVYRDSTLIVINQATETVPHVEIRNLADHRFVGNRIPLGKGPGEMLQVFAYLNGNTLQVNDFVKKQIVLMNVDSLLSFSERGHLPPFFQYRFFAFGKAPLRDGRWVFENPYAFKHEKSGIVNYASSRILVGDEWTESEDLGTYTYETSNVSQGMLFTNPAKNRLVYASLNFPIIEFYDCETSSVSLSKVIVGPDDFSDQQFSIDQGGVIFHSTIPYAYLAYCFDDDYLYLTYVGEMMNFREKQEQDLHSWIFRFDWAGNFKDSYYCPSHITALSIGCDGRTLYATVREQRDNMPLLVKLSGIGD